MVAVRWLRDGQVTVDGVTYQGHGPRYELASAHPGMQSAVHEAPVTFGEVQDVPADVAEVLRSLRLAHYLPDPDRPGRYLK
jgi:hypothetical protein